MAKNNEQETSSSINIIGLGTIITGDILSNGDIRIDGGLTGNLRTKGKIVIGETGKIKGEIRCKNSDIAGEVEGKTYVSELLTLKSTARIFGDIQATKLAIEPGCKFTGFCNMSGTNIQDAEKRLPGAEREEAGTQ
jgi:cytoskeletal protein CcmA (bactofilin family)